jgi:Holliday junction resolvase RusA-like endonuclease
MRRVEVFVPHEPISQPRATPRRSGPFARRRMTTPRQHPIRLFRAIAAHQFRLAAGPDWTPIEGPVEVITEYRFPRLAKQRYRRRPWKPLWADTAPEDLDNLMKGLWDAMHGRAWRDDHQICQAITRKIRVGTGSIGVAMVVSSLDAPPPPGALFVGSALLGRLDDTSGATAD